MAKNRITIETNPAVITLVQKGTGLNSDSNEYDYNYAPIGADDENIQIYEISQEDEDIVSTKWGSLRNFFQEWLNFKKIWKNFTDEAQFIQYGTTTPINNNVKIWFEIKDNNN